MLEKAKAAVKLALILAWIGLCYVVAWTSKKLGKYVYRDKVVQLCYGGLLRIIGIELTVIGQAANIRPLLLVANHLSYLDIIIIGSQAPIRFTPKSDVEKWPAIGKICHLCDAIFIDRRPEKISDMKRDVHSALAKGELVCLFPEGTTGSGTHLHPFKSGFFSLAEEEFAGQELAIQPVAIAYTHIRKLPIDSTQWPRIAWYGDMELFPHLWEFLQLGPLKTKIIFLPTVTLKQYEDRKKLATYCHSAITDAKQSAIINI